MTDYELANLLVIQVQTMFEVLTTYITIVSGFLVVGYLVAHKLNRSMVAVLVVLFSMASLGCAVGMRSNVAGVSNTGRHLGEAIAAGTAHFGWRFSGARSPAIASTMPLMMQSIFVVAYIGALVFFFHQRRAGLKAAV
jgi:hypothetical protein